jgi:hypothetical protein
MPCSWCHRPTAKRFVVGDDLENPRPYHKLCYSRMMERAMIEFYTRKR